MSSVDDSHVTVYHPDWIPTLVAKGWIPKQATAESDKSTFVVISHKAPGTDQVYPPTPHHLLLTPEGSRYATAYQEAEDAIAYLSTNLWVWTLDTLMVDRSLNPYQQESLKQAQEVFGTKPESLGDWFEAHYGDCINGVNEVGDVHYLVTTLPELQQLLRMLKFDKPRTITKGGHDGVKDEPIIPAPKPSFE